MLLMFLSTVILIPTLMGWGNIIHSVLGPCTRGVAGHAFSGILGLSIIFTILSFFTPLNFYVEISAICMGLLFF